MKQRLLCHPAYLYEVAEDAITQCGCISIVDESHTEQMIFLFKDEDISEYEVRVYKARPTDTYVPHRSDCTLKRYVANDEFASFFFENFVFAREFICKMKTAHPEYAVRPIQEIKS